MQCLYILTVCMYLDLFLHFVFCNSLPFGAYIWSLEIFNALCPRSSTTWEMKCLLSWQESRLLWWFYLGLNLCLRRWLIRKMDIRIRKFLPTIRRNHTPSRVSDFKLLQCKDGMKNEFTSLVENQLMVIRRILMVIATILLVLGSLNMLFHGSFQQPKT